MKARAIKQFLNLKHKFTTDEINTFGHDLAQQEVALARLEDEKKSMSADIKSKQEVVKAQIKQLTTYITNGYTHRDVECEIKMNTPKDGKKTAFRTDTGEQVGVYDMTHEERQEKLFEDERQKEEKAKKGQSEKDGK